jgi:hypothetical protein
MINDGQATAGEAISYIIRRAFGGQEAERHEHCRRSFVNLMQESKNFCRRAKNAKIPGDDTI